MDRKRTQARAEGPDEFLSVEEAAAMAGVRRNAVHRWVTDGRFRSSRPIASGSGRRLIDRQSFLAFLRGEVAVDG